MSGNVNAAGLGENTTFKPAKKRAEIEFINAKTLLEKGISGEVLIGTLEEVLVNQFGSEDYAFTRSSDGARVVVNGCGTLRAQLRDVEMGTLCRISYSGSEKIAKGAMKGKSAHQFLVEVASDNSNG